MSDSIVELVNELPQGGLTVRVLKALDFVAPGTWHQTDDFDDLITQVTGASDRATIDRVRQKADQLYKAKDTPYSFCVRLYRTIDKTDSAIGMAAMANKVGEKVKFLSVLNKLTPKADNLQAFDLVLKIAVELVVFSKLNGISPNPAKFAKALGETYSGASLTRMVTLVCIDGLLPLGPEFINKVQEILSESDGKSASKNSAFKTMGTFIPGGESSDKLSFVKNGFDSASDWMGGLVERTHINPSQILSSVAKFIDSADGKMDFVAAFLDQATNYFEHTGIITVATHVIKEAHKEVGQLPPAATPVAPAPRSVAPAVAAATTATAAGFAAVAAAPTPPSMQPQPVQTSIPPERIGADGQFNQSGLAQRVILAFKSDPSLSGMTNLYAAQAGSKVVLKGRVPSQQLYNRAVQLAKVQQGCTEVDASQLAIG
ncbi:MAG: hypothetical protein F6J87_04890 [Spirulina sp. SIO3F2]|nr:hypothetical protein [Spirulina sp. SIO3F2]